LPMSGCDISWRSRMTVRPDVKAVLDYLKTSSTPPIEQTDPATARVAMVESVTLADVSAPALAISRTISVPGAAGELPALLLDSRVDRNPGPLVVWFHGGGFVTGGLDTHQGFCSEVARQLDLPVLLVAYRLAPEVRFPAAHQDAEAVARWVASGPEVLDRGVTSLVLGGDSAGGNLALVTAQALRDRPAAVPLTVQVAIYPSTDETRTYPSQDEFAAGYLLTEAGKRWYREHTKAVPEDLRSSPINGVLAGLAPAVIMTAGADPNRDEGRAYAAALVAAGVPTTFLEAAGNVHAFVLLRQVVPSAQRDVTRALSALREVLQR